jgi:hypothetical protein
MFLYVIILYSYNIIYNMQAKVIGRGSSGCVVHPAIPCTGEGTLRDKISKILPKTDASKEFDMIAELAGLEQFAI